MTDEMKGKVCVITGSNSGIGKSTALGLASMGATVIMVCRDESRGEAARQQIIDVTGNPSVHLMVADLSSRQSVYQLVKDFRHTHEKIHVLVNNAGVFRCKRSLTVDGLETTFAVNHLAYFMLTNLLLDVLKRSSARIVNVSSETHRRGTIDFNDLQGEKRYNGFKAYNQSKLANILFTYELTRGLSQTEVTVNCLHPGAVRTNLFLRDCPWWFRYGYTTISPFLLSPEKGAETSLYLASSPAVEGISGKYFVRKKEVRSSKESYDEDLSRRLWDVSAELTKTS